MPEKEEKDKPKAQQTLPKPGFGDILKTYILRVEVAYESFSLVHKLVTEQKEKSKTEFVAFIESPQNAVKKNNTYGVKPEAVLEFRKVAQNLNKSASAGEIVPSSLFVMLISQFDILLDRIIKAIFRKVPELLDEAISKKGDKKEEQVSYNLKLSKHESLEHLKEYLMHAVVESVLRKSHKKQFEWLGNLLQMPLNKDLACWPEFIELTERRNLFVHNDGKVSEYYIQQCSDAGYVFKDKPVVDSKLEITPEYFKRAYQVLSEIGIKLHEVIWRKLDTEAYKVADANLNDICVELIKKEQYEIADVLLDFALNVLKKHEEETLLYLEMNKLQNLKWMKKTAEFDTLIKSRSWNSRDTIFKFAISVLRDDYKAAEKLMAKIGKEEIDENSYKDWPIFKEFRNTPEFLRGFEKKFGKKFLITDIAPKKAKSASLPKAKKKPARKKIK